MKKLFFSMTLLTGLSFLLSGCGDNSDDVITLRVANCEEYIDLGDWDEDEVIDLSDDVNIIGENALYVDFEEWYYEQYGKKVKVEYSTYGTNEDLYNQLTIGDVYDVACPSEYMIMKMAREDMLVPLSEDFFNKEDPNNYYKNGVSPFIDKTLNDLTIEGKSIHDYAAGYMWGTLGIVYNPEVVSAEDAAHWNLLINKDYYRQITIKDSVRDAYFAAVAINYYDKITDAAFLNQPDYHDKLSECLNSTDADTVNAVQKVLTLAKDNVYAFETDAGKADMVTGKVVANEQWSGDAVYTMDQAEEDGFFFEYSAPEEGTNIWFDGWVMLKCGIDSNPDKQHAAESFINYISKPESVVRNMYYIGYTSCISGGDNSMIFDYIDWNYSADPEEEECVLYPIGYFFDLDDEDADEKYCITTSVDQTKRQLYAQYPPKEVIDRSVIMSCFLDEDNIRVNRMWTNVRCFDLFGD